MGEIERLLAERGFDRVTHFGAEEAVRRYFGGTDVGMPDLQRLVTAVVDERSRLTCTRAPASQAITFTRRDTDAQFRSPVRMESASRMSPAAITRASGKRSDR